jgi:hypothetical protein
MAKFGMTYGATKPDPLNLYSYTGECRKLYHACSVADNNHFHQIPQFRKFNKLLKEF